MLGDQRADLVRAAPNGEPFAAAKEQLARAPEGDADTKRLFKEMKRREF